MLITFLTVSIHLKSVLPQCCVNKVSYFFSSHISHCYHSDVAKTFLTVTIHLKYVLPQCCVNKVSYSFSTHISPCFYSALSITYLTLPQHVKVIATTVLWQCLSYCLFKIHQWRQSIVRTVDSDLRIYCFYIGQVGHYIQFLLHG